MALTPTAAAGARRRARRGRRRRGPGVDGRQRAAGPARRRPARRPPGQLHRRGRRLRPDRPHAAAPTRCATACCSASASASGTLVVGGGLAVLVSFCDFPGRRWLDWALVLPMAMPGYVLVFVAARPVRPGAARSSRTCSATACDIPGLRTPGGADRHPDRGPLPLRLRARAAARSSASPARPSRRPAAWAAPTARPCARSPCPWPARPWPPARPWRSWRRWPTSAPSTCSASRRSPAPSTGCGTAPSTRTPRCSWPPSSSGSRSRMVTIERVLRGRARYHQALGRGDAIVPGRLRRLAAVARRRCPASLLLAVVFGLPVVQLAAWSVETIADDTTRRPRGPRPQHAPARRGHRRSVAVVDGDGRRLRASGPQPLARRSASWPGWRPSGYAVPGTVVAVAVYVPLVWFDRRLVDVAEDVLGRDIGLDVHRHDPRPGPRLHRALPRPRLLRRSRPAWAASAPTSTTPPGPSAPTGPASWPTSTCRCCGPGLLTAALLVLVEVMKELPATALLRPLGRRHAGHHRLGGHQGLPPRRRRAAGPAHRARRAGAGDRARAPHPARGLDLGRRPGLTTVRQVPATAARESNP